MGCRSSAPVVEGHPLEEQEFFTTSTTMNGRPATGLEVVTLADLVALEDRLVGNNNSRRRGRSRSRNHDERMAELAALQHGLSMMENLFENLIGQSTFFTEAMDPNNNVDGIGPPPASDAAIASLVCSPLTEKQVSLLPNKTCIVCCEVLECDGENVTRLPCGHTFHPNCVEPWLKRHCTCPTCRYELPTDDADFEEGRMERMKTRKLPAGCSHPTNTVEENSSSDSSYEDEEATHPGITWDETSTASWGAESDYGLPALDWDGLFEDFMEPYAETLARAQRNSIRSRNDTSWMIRLIDEDTEDRPTSTLPAAVERMASLDNVRDDSPNEPQGDPTPKHSNESHHSNRFHYTDNDDEMIAANHVDDCNPND